MTFVTAVLAIIADSELSAMVKDRIQVMGHISLVADSIESASNSLLNGQIAYIIIDAELENFPLKDFICEVRLAGISTRSKNPVPILILGHDLEEVHAQVGHLEGVRYLQRPFNCMDLTKMLLSLEGQSKFTADQIRPITKGAFLINEGGSSEEMYWVISGKFNIIKKDNDGNNIVVGSVEAGEVIGEMSFLDAQPRSASVKAVEESEVLVIPQHHFLRNFDEQPPWFRSLLRTLSRRLRKANELVAQTRGPSEEFVELGQDDINALIASELGKGI